MDWFARAFAGVLFACGLLIQANALAATAGTIVLKTETGDHRFDIEVADTDLERARGLMYRRALPKNGGMLFLYDRPQHIVMWMKNTFIPLDMVFITADGRVHRIESNAEPFSTDRIASGGVVVSVLELNAGEARRIGLKPGDRVFYSGLGQGR